MTDEHGMNELRKVLSNVAEINNDMGSLALKLGIYEPEELKKVLEILLTKDLTPENRRNCEISVKMLQTACEVQKLLMGLAREMVEAMLGAGELPSETEDRIKSLLMGEPATATMN